MSIIQRVAPDLWLPKIKELLVPEQKFKGVGVAGFYKIEARKPDGRMRLLADWFPNIITNGGLDMYDSSSWLSTCVVGSGNTAPAVTDTQLVSLAASTTSTNFQNKTIQSSAPYFGSVITQYNFPIGTATGNLSEVGVGTGTTALFSRALILDGGGSPTTITILSNEALYVTYQVNHYVPTTDYTNSFTLNGVSYSFTLRAALATSIGPWAYAPSDPSYFFGDGGPGSGNFSSLNVSNGTISAITGDITGTTSSAGSATHSNYTNGTFQRAVTATWGLGNGNVSGGVTAGNLLFGPINLSRGRYQWSCTPAIPKDSSHVLTLNFTNLWTRGP